MTPSRSPEEHVASIPGVTSATVAEGRMLVTVDGGLDATTVALRAAIVLNALGAGLPVEVAPDGQGRLAIPAGLRSFARLEGDVVVNGAINHVELWNAAKWAEIDAEGSQFLLSGTDALDDIGF